MKLLAVLVLLSGCGTWEAIVGVAAEPTVQAAVEDTVEHIPEVIANPMSPYAWYGLAAGIAAVATAVTAAVKKRKKKARVGS